MPWSSFEELRKRFAQRQDAYRTVDKTRLDAYLHQLDTMIRDEGRNEAVHDFLARRRYKQAQRIVQMAMQMLGTSHAEVNVITETEQITIAGDAGQKVCQREHSWCQNVVGLADVLAVEDGDAHPLVKDAPSSEIRSYLGAPIRVHGYPIGSLCVFDEAPRHWTEADADRLSMLAGILGDSTPEMAKPNTPKPNTPQPNTPRKRRS